MSIEKTPMSKVKAAEKSTFAEGETDIGDCATDQKEKSAMRQWQRGSGWERREHHEEVRGEA